MKLDLSNRKLQKIDASILKDNLECLSSCGDGDDLVDEKNIQTALFDNNFLSKLDSLDKFSNLKHLSLTNNRLIEIKAISKLYHLEFVNLLNNSLTNLNAFKELRNLRWINVSGNQIKSLESLNYNIHLEYIDASNNEISEIDNLSSLLELGTLNLNGNELEELASLPNCLSQSLTCLLISHNVIEDLNQICYLAHLDKLEILSVEDNPCTSYISGANYESMFDYRPYVINWCLNLLKLDDIIVNQKEYLKAEWLYSQGKGRHFRPGQNQQLVEHLIKTCPFTKHLSIEEDVRLSKVLEKKEVYKSETNDFKLCLLDKKLKDLPRNVINTLIDNHTYEKKIESLDFRNPVNSVSPNREIEKELNLIDHINLSSSDSGNNGINNELTNLDHEHLVDNPEKMDSDLNRSKYSDYDSRPIKPLDPNKLNKQLTEYPEMSQQELEELKTRTAQHIRSKTTDPISNSKLTPSHSHVQRTVNKSPMVRQLSFNSNRANNNSVLQVPKKNTLISNNPTNKLNKRSKTENELQIKTKSAQSTPTKPNLLQQNKPKYNATNYSPLKQTNNSPYLRQISSSRTDVSKPKVQASMLTRKCSVPRSDGLSSTKTLSSNKAISTDNISEQRVENNLKNTPREVKKSEASLKATKELKHSEIHSKIQRQRQEMLLTKQKNLNEFRNQLKLEHERSQLRTHALNESFTKDKIPKSSPIFTFEDRCAIKIQALWRGYRARNMVRKRQNNNSNSYKSLLEYVGFLRTNLSSLLSDHKNLVNCYQDDIGKLTNAFTLLASALSPKDTLESKLKTFEQEASRAANAELLNENRELKEKIAYLEDKYAQLDEKYTHAIEKSTNQKNVEETTHDNINDTVNNSTISKVCPKVEIFPPIRVRLQKLNEKRVALKWNHNPQNNLTEIHGYSIYINGKLCGKMSPNDLVASINGIQEEGEYKIYIRAFFKTIESENSNEVVTRVKRKAAYDETSATEQDTQELTSEQNTNSNDASSSQSNLTDEATHGNDSSNSSNDSSQKKEGDKKDFLEMMKERLSGIVSQSDSEEIAEHLTSKHQKPNINIASRIARNPIPPASNSNAGYRFLSESEKKALDTGISQSSVESFAQNSHGQDKQYGDSGSFEPFGQMVNRLNAKASRAEPSEHYYTKSNSDSIGSIVKQSVSIDDENDENISSQAELAYLNNIKPLKESRRKSENSVLW